jgi:hypothetical protein
MEKTVWHYSIYPHLLSMLRDGFIKPATAFVEPPERPNRLVQPESNLGTDGHQGSAVAGWKFSHARFPSDVVPRYASRPNRGVTRGCALRMARPAEIERNGVTNGERPCSCRQRHGGRSSGLVWHPLIPCRWKFGATFKSMTAALGSRRGAEGVPRSG